MKIETNATSANPLWKHAPTILLACLLIWTSGCATTQLIEGAKPTEKRDDHGEIIETKPGNPAAYAAVPFTLVSDVATAPFVGIYAGFLMLVGFQN
jgi:hypothetical protein